MKSKFTLRKKCLEKRDIFFKNKGSECLKFKDIKALILDPGPPQGEDTLKSSVFGSGGEGIGYRV